MKIWIALIVASLAVGAYAQCSCETMKWATCDGSPCTCHLMTGNGTKQVLDCTKLIPKCFLMQAEMYRARKGLSTRGIGGKPDETAFVDNDGIYDPDCENDGTFKAKQCNNTDTCWCVNSAGVRRTDKGDKDLKCEESQDPFTPTVGGQKLEFENILVYYVDEKAPTFTMKNLSGGIIAVIVVVVLAVVAGLLVLVFAKKRQGKYNKAQQRELDNM
uniref:Thyroglobulin type-1 domain-containing protein n=1 Tax=Periophthalmus magnuspinnatus TaxID=409849 RepID=A0A3B4B3J3_9GOBI